MQACGCPPAIQAHASIATVDNDLCSFSGPASENSCGGDDCCLYVEYEKNTE